MAATFLGDLQNHAVGGASLVITAAASTNALLGTAIDFITADGALTGILTTGTVTGTAVDLDVKLQESADGTSSFTDITGGAFTQSFNETTADSVFEVLTTIYRTKRYVRAHISVTGTAVTSVPVSVAVLSQKKIRGVGTYTGF